MIKKLFLIILIYLSATSANAADVTWGSSTQLDASSIRNLGAGTITSDKFVVCWSEGNGRCVVATVSGTTPSPGTQVQFNTDIDGGVDVLQAMGVAKADTDQFTVFYMQDVDDSGVGITANVSTTTISFGAELNHDTNDVEEFRGAAGIAADKVVLTYNDEGNSDTCETVVCTNDATPNLTCGSEVACDGDGTTDFYPAYIDTTKLDTDKWVSCWNANDDSDDGYCVVGTASTTTITYDVGPSQFADAVAISQLGVCSPSREGGTADRFVVVYDNAGETTAMAGTVSTRTITYGAANSTIDSTTTADHPECTFVTETKFLIVWEDTTNTDGTTRLMSVDWSTREISTAGTEEDFTTSQIGDSSLNQQSTQLITLSGFDGVAPKVAAVYIIDLGDTLNAIIGDLSFPVAGTRRLIF